MLTVQYSIQFSGPPKNIFVILHQRFDRMVIQPIHVGSHFLHFYYLLDIIIPRLSCLLHGRTPALNRGHNN